MEKEKQEMDTKHEVPDLNFSTRFKYYTILDALLEVMVEKQKRESRRSRFFGIFRKRRAPSVKAPTGEEDFLSGCLHHFGYLASRPKNVHIPQECIICKRLTDCMLKTVR